MEITKEQFNSYRRVQYSGVINMLDTKNGTILTGLPKDTYMEIIHNYGKLVEKYGEFEDNC